jgi:hypothetical protein
LGECKDVDLSVVSAEPVQVLYGVPLVRNKGTVFRVTVKNTATIPVKTNFSLILPADQWDMVRGNAIHKNLIPSTYIFPEKWGPVEIPAHANNFEVILPYIPNSIRDDTILFTAIPQPPGTEYAGKKLADGRVGPYDLVPKLRAVPKPVARKVSFSVVVNPENQIQTPAGFAISEINHDNNRFNSPDYFTITTVTQAFAVQQIAVTQPKISDNTSTPNENEDNPYTPFCNPSTSFETSRISLIENIEFFLATYPVADDNIYGRYAFPVFSYNFNQGDRNVVWNAGDSLIQGTEYNWYIGQECGGFGQSPSTGRAVTIGNFTGTDSTLAHEIGHKYAAGSAPDCYFDGGKNDGCDCPQCSCLASEGFWVNGWQRIPEGSGVCSFMGNINKAPLRWAGKDRIGGLSVENGLTDGGYVNIMDRLRLSIWLAPA